jgi:hypothetical protein
MAERSDASPTGDPHIAQSEEAEMDAQRAARAARLFDVRRLIGGLFLIYGVILVILGLGESDKSIAKSADMNVNLWSGLGMLVLAALFLAWAFLRPLGEERDEAGEDDRSVKGAPAPVGADAAALSGSKTTRRRPRSDRGGTGGQGGAGG